MKAMILAAGRGERMRPLTDHLPKPLLQVGGTPLIGHHLHALAAAGIQDVVINHAWLGQLIEQQLGNGAGYGVNLQYSAEGEKGLETAGGIVKALPLLGSDPFMVINGDVFTDYPFRMLAEARASHILAHLVLVPNPAQHPLGDFGLDTDSGLALPSADTQFTYSGIGWFRPEFFAEIAQGPQKLAPYLREAMARRQVSAEVYGGLWADIGTPERLAQINQEQRDRQYVG
jgi:MurNAc alpha-1-phosphate uridylyltransferase